MLNFENKLAGLENRPDYPKEKPWYFRPERDSDVDYNIITNYSLKDHYFDAPDKRPECEEFKVSFQITLIFYRLNGPKIKTKTSRTTTSLATSTWSTTTRSWWLMNAF